MARKKASHEEETGDGCFSSDSSFYGDDDLKEDLEDQARNFDPVTYWSIHDSQPATIAFKAMVENPKTSTTPKTLYNMYEGDPCGRQLSESVPAFLSRLPPLTTPISNPGPWLYIGNPHTKHRHSSEHRKAFIERGHEILEEFDSVKQGIEASLAGKPKATITRKLTPLRKKLELDLLTAARGKGCTTGKWMFFPTPADVNHTWSVVATATANNELGLAAKVATDEGGDDPDKARLICVYTEDFDDKADVKRVLERLIALGLCNRSGAMAGGRAIYYKVDAYTYLEIMGGNEWGLRASMYSSRDFFGEGK